MLLALPFSEAHFLLCQQVPGILQHLLQAYLLATTVVQLTSQYSEMFGVAAINLRDLFCLSSR
ncbi:hypothetical protein D3C81_1685440 [compost metagenome]